MRWVFLDTRPRQSGHDMVKQIATWSSNEHTRISWGFYWSRNRIFTQSLCVRDYTPHWFESSSPLLRIFSLLWLLSVTWGHVNKLTWNIRMIFKNLSKELSCYVVYVRLAEYAAPAWNPHFSYTDRLRELALTALEERRDRGDMIRTYCTRSWRGE